MSPVITEPTQVITEPTQVITELSICIPRTLANITWRQVKDTFEQLLGVGTVERVDIVTQKTETYQPFCRIFVHFRYWPNTPESMGIRQRLIDGETIKIVYDNPWFWKCSASRVAKPERNTVKHAPYVEFTTPNKPITPMERCPSPLKERPPTKKDDTESTVMRQPVFGDKEATDVSAKVGAEIAALGERTEWSDV